MVNLWRIFFNRSDTSLRVIWSFATFFCIIFIFTWGLSGALGIDYIGRIILIWFLIRVIGWIICKKSCQLFTTKLYETRRKLPEFADSMIAAAAGWIAWSSLLSPWFSSCVRAVPSLTPTTLGFQSESSIRRSPIGGSKWQTATLTNLFKHIDYYLFLYQSRFQHQTH